MGNWAKPFARPTLGDLAEGASSHPPLELNGLIEAGWTHLDPFVGPPLDEWVIDTLEFMLTLRPHPWISAQVSADYEDNGRTPAYLDVAHLIFGPPDGTWFIDAGQLYLPFSRYETHMASDPLTLALGETREITAALGFERDPFFGAIYAFSDQDLNGKTGTIDERGCRTGIRQSARGEATKIDLRLPQRPRQFRWAHEQDYSAARGGTGKAGNTITAQITIEF
jgi:hypothetical protein